jgi:glyoxylase-like metal-dependent hydrolase (beta-lactamase superfamily II)
MKLWAIILGFLLATNSAFADDDFPKEVVKITRLTPSMFMLEGAGGNMTASIGTDGTLLVDCDFAEMSEKLVAKLHELGGGSPRYIINTHFHYDHTGANQVFGKTATIIAATPVRTRLMSEQVLWHKSHPAFPHEGLPIVTFEDGITIHINNDEVETVHYPHAHTDGDSVVFFDKQKVASLGDLYFAGMYPIFHPEHQGSLDGYLAALKLILKRVPDDAQVVPGHGPLTNKAALERYTRMIEASIAVVKEGLKRKLTLSQIQKNGLPKEWESFSHGYRTTDQWLESIYQSIVRDGASN